MTDHDLTPPARPNHPAPDTPPTAAAPYPPSAVNDAHAATVKAEVASPEVPHMPVTETSAAEEASAAEAMPYKVAAAEAAVPAAEPAVETPPEPVMAPLPVTPTEAVMVPPPPPETPTSAASSKPPAAVPAPQSKANTGGTPLWLTLVVVLGLGGGLYWIYTHPPEPAAAQGKDTAADPALQALQQRLAAIEQRPAAAATTPPDLAPLESRIAAAESALRAQAAHPGTPADVSGLANRVAALEQRPAAAGGDVTAPIAAAIAPLAARLDAADTKLQALASQDSGASASVAKLSARLDAIEAKLQQVATQATARAESAARLRAATAALAAGQKLGDLPGAPPALTRFAQTPPPTEAALRLAFTTAAASAEAASQPSTAGLGVFARMWQRVTALVTIRQGDNVVIGPPAAVTLNRARLLLDAGDLNGTLSALTALDARAAAAMAPWRSNVQSVLDARAALAALEARP